MRAILAALLVAWGPVVQQPAGFGPAGAAGAAGAPGPTGPPGPNTGVAAVTFMNDAGIVSTPGDVTISSPAGAVEATFSSSGDAGVVLPTGYCYELASGCAVCSTATPSMQFLTGWASSPANEPSLEVESGAANQSGHVQIYGYQTTAHGYYAPLIYSTAALALDAPNGLAIYGGGYEALYASGGNTTLYAGNGTAVLAAGSAGVNLANLPFTVLSSAGITVGSGATKLTNLCVGGLGLCSMPTTSPTCSTSCTGCSANSVCFATPNSSAATTDAVGVSVACSSAGSVTVTAKSAPVGSPETFNVWCAN